MVCNLICNVYCVFVAVRINGHIVKYFRRKLPRFLFHLGFEVIIIVISAVILGNIILRRIETELTILFISS
jgi:hypothetical protein